MQGASRQSLTLVRERLDALSASPQADPGAVGGQLFAVVDVLDRQPALRRALSDSSASEDRRGGLANQLFGDQIGEVSLRVLDAVVRSRWSNPDDLTDATEILGRQALLSAAEQFGRLDEVEDELFRFSRIVEQEPELLAAYANRRAPRDVRLQLLDSLIGDKVTDVTQALLERTIGTPRVARLERALSQLSEDAASRRRRSIAVIRSAVSLTEAQRGRLAAALGRIYRREISIQVDVDPALLGGMIVTVGGDVIDGSAASLLSDARRGLAQT